MKKNNNKLIVFSLGILCLLSSVRFADNAGWIADVFSHFPLQYALISFVFMLICLWRRTVRLAVLSGLLFLVNISSIIDFEESIQATEHVRTTFKIYLANINIHNEELSRLNNEIRKIDPEIVLLLEVTSNHVEQIRSAKQNYPYHIENIPADALFGFVFLSKFPVLNYNVTSLYEEGNSILEAVLEIDKKPIVFYGTHVPRPAIYNFNERRNNFLWLARQIKSQISPVIVAGDLNTTPFSPVFRKLLETARLKDSREGFGWQPSWPAQYPPDFLYKPMR